MLNLSQTEINLAKNKIQDLNNLKNQAIESHDYDLIHFLDIQIRYYQRAVS